MLTSAATTRGCFAAGCAPTWSTSVAHESPAERLCDAGVPTWVVHAEKGDGGLTDEGRRALEACPRTNLITIPGTCYFLPDEEPERVAKIIAEAISHAA